MPGATRVGSEAGREMAAAVAEKKAMEARVSAVREVVQGFSKDQILLVLQHFELDVPKTIHAFCEDGAQEALQTWSGGVASKSRKGKGKPSPPKAPPAKPSNGASSNGAPANGSAKPSNGNGHVAHPAPAPAVAPAHPNGAVPAQAPKPQRSPRKNPTPAPPAPEEPLAPSRERLISSSSSVSDAVGKKKSLDKELKEMARKEAGLTRASERFRAEVQSSGERLRRAFDEVREALDAREAALKADLAATKAQGNRLLAERSDYARRLHAQVERAPSLSDRDLDLLRHDLKAFAHDRRQDEELASTLRFHYEPHPIAAAVEAFGTVVPVTVVKGAQPPVSPPPRPAPAPAPVPKPTHEAAMESNGITMKSSSLTAAELEEINRKLQESLLSQGISGSVLGMVGGNSAAVARRPQPRRPPPKAQGAKANGKGPKGKGTPAPELSILQ